MRDDAPMTEAPRSPLDLLGRLGQDEFHLGGGRRLVEMYTTGGLLQLMWHGDPSATDVVICCPGAIGGFIGPAGGLYLRLGAELADRGIAVIGVDYRRPDRIDRSFLDTVATAELAIRQGAQRIALLGHSFGGAVAIQAGSTIGSACVGVCTLATQSAGCEHAAELAPTPLLLLHGDQDQMLGPENSLMVRQLAGYGEVEIVAGGDHGLATAAHEVGQRVVAFLASAFGFTGPPDHP